MLRRSLRFLAQSSAALSKQTHTVPVSTSLVSSNRQCGSVAKAAAAESAASSRDVMERLPQSLGYVARHIGPQNSDTERILAALGVSSLDELMSSVIPSQIRSDLPENSPDSSIPPAQSDERAALAELESIMARNSARQFRSFIGTGYYDCTMPSVIQRCLFENPSWYTPYTPYQAEISQGRLEMLLNFQTMVSSLCKTGVCNASLLDEATACSEAMTMSFDIINGRLRKGQHKRKTMVVSSGLHPQNIEVMRTRAEPLGIEVETLDSRDETAFLDALSARKEDVFGVIVSYPDTFGNVSDLGRLAQHCHELDIVSTAVVDPLALTLLTPPGDQGIDICVGSTQRFGVPLGFGGPHAGFMACDEKHLRKMPGRIIGLTRDSRGFDKALRMALQVREQHIKRERATSNICTAQALLANVAAAYGIYHGPIGLRNIACRIYALTETLRLCVQKSCLESGIKCVNTGYGASHFDTVHFSLADGQSADEFVKRARTEAKMNLRRACPMSFTVSFDEVTSIDDVKDLVSFLSGNKDAEQVRMMVESTLEECLNQKYSSLMEDKFVRRSSFMEHEVFHKYHSETAMMRYLYYLERKDLGLNTAMIPLGSCTMKLNAATTMIPVSWPNVGGVHPFVPADQAQGYSLMLSQLSDWLSELTGFVKCSMQPNSGAQGEYAGLLAIRRYHESRGEADKRNICLIPVSAHGTNPASATMLGYKVVAVKCDKNGDVDLENLKHLAEKHSDSLAATMITYPSTHGVFEEAAKTICQTIHNNGGLVYMDGANLQAQVGYCSPGDIGADVCHLNLHKTFCIPHGGGGPGLGPICVNERLAPYLPGHSFTQDNSESDPTTSKLYAIAGAPYSSASIAVIPWMYIRMMGVSGIRRATATAIANANYMMGRLKDHFPVLYTGTQGRCAHEFIVDIRPLKKSCGVTAEDIAKRLMDFGFHAPTMSFPVSDTLMIEPTESEPLSELDRLCDAMIEIRSEIARIEAGEMSVEASPLRRAPHTIDVLSNSQWDRAYPREVGSCVPFFTTRGQSKEYWPSVGRVDNVFGDQNPSLVCGCPTVEELSEWDLE